MNLSYNIDLTDTVVCFSFEGKILTELDYSEAEKAVFNHLNQNYTHVVFDLSKLTHTNSSGIAFFMRTLTKSRIMGGELILSGLNGNVAKIFSIAKLDEVYTIVEDQSEAVNHFKELQ